MSLIRNDYKKISKPVIAIADGWSQLFPSIREAAIRLGVDPNTLCKKLKHQNDDGIEIYTKKYGAVCVDYAPEEEV